MWSWGSASKTGGLDAVAQGARPALVLTARFGLLAKGAVQFLVGVLALSAVSAGGRGVTDGLGALMRLARERHARPLLLVFTLGLFAYAGLRLVQGVFDPQRRPRKLATALLRIGDVLSAAGYVLLGVGAGRLFVGLGATSGDARSRALAAEALALPYGPKMLVALAVILGALAVLFVARALVVRDVCGDLLTDDLGPLGCRVAATLIRFGSLVQALLFGTMAQLIYRAALWHDPSAARGMAGVMRVITARQGTLVLALVGIGFLAMAGTSLIEARWRKELGSHPARRGLASA